MERVVIVGTAGAGTSTLARAVAERLDAPVVTAFDGLAWRVVERVAVTGA